MRPVWNVAFSVGVLFVSDIDTIGNSFLFSSHDWCEGGLEMTAFDPESVIWR